MKRGTQFSASLLLLRNRNRLRQCEGLHGLGLLGFAFKLGALGHFDQILIVFNNSYFTDCFT